MNRCPNYTGISCVNGYCPSALAEEYSEYGYEHVTCDSCGYYKGCEDCAWCMEDGGCEVEKSEECNNDDVR